MIKHYEYEDLINLLKNKKVVCVGAGKNSLKLNLHLEEIDLLEKIIFFIDNDNTKNSAVIDKKTFDVFPFGKLKELSDSHVIIITPAKYDEIIEQLETYDCVNKSDIFLLSQILGLIEEHYALTRSLPVNIKITSEPIIPKKIHYFWFGGKPLPDKYKEWMASWKKYCPDYEIIEWNENNYDITKNKYMYEAYQAKKWGFVPDYARLDVIYEHGGIYLDTDVELIANIDDLLYQEAFACFESRKYVAFGLGFGAVPKNSVIKKLRDYYDSLSFFKNDGSLNLIASPFLQTDCLSSMGLKQNGEYQIVENLTVYPEKMLCGMSETTRRIKLSDFTRAIHHYDGSWLTEEQKKLLSKKIALFK